MAKDDRIWILDNYYMGFIKGLNQNQHIEHIPSKTALENAGCNISGMCYLITPGGSQFNPRTLKPNELASSIRALFESPQSDDEVMDDEEDQIGELAEEAAEICTPAEPEKVNDYVADATSQVCEECGESKPLEAFKKMPGRGIKRQSVCIECKAKHIADVVEPVKTYVPPNSDPVVEDDEQKDKVALVPMTWVMELVKEAYERGKSEKQQNVVMPSLDELIGA